MRWIWIDKFVEFEPGRRAVALKNVTRAEDHLHDVYPAFPVMPASLIIEGMAQTAGILVGHARDFTERVILAKVRHASLGGAVTPGDQLLFEALLEHIDDAGAITTGFLRCNGERYGEVNLAFSHLPTRAAAQLGIPEDNFVFTDEFRHLLSTCPSAAPIV